MHFELTEEQQMIKDMCRLLAKKENNTVAGRHDETKAHPVD